MAALGEAFRCNDPGWFRIITAAPPEVMDLALERIGGVLSRRHLHVRALF